jgi:hypothetical protein
MHLHNPLSNDAKKRIGREYWWDRRSASMGGLEGKRGFDVFPGWKWTRCLLVMAFDGELNNIGDDMNVRLACFPYI